MSLVSYYFIKSVATRKFKITYVAPIISGHSTSGNGKPLKGCGLGRVKLGDK